MISTIVRICVALILSVIATVALLFGAGMFDGMCHCMTSMFTVFPYGSFVMMHFSSDTWGMLLTFIQIPVYVLMVMLAKGVRWKLGVALLLIVLHVAAASFALHDYCQSRRNCLLRTDDINVRMS
jgi:hypothetical protein